MTDIDYEVAYGVARVELAKANVEIKRLLALVKKYEDEQGAACRAYREAAARRALENKPEREYDPDVAPCDDAEFGMKP
jgi:hypothetical protein